MKMKPGGLLIFFLLLTLPWPAGLLSGCRLEGQGSPELPVAAFFQLQAHEDPYVLQGKPFSLDLLVALPEETLAAYDLLIHYDPGKLILSTVPAPGGIQAGWDGFVDQVLADHPGLVRVTGRQEAGPGPGSDLELLELTWLPLYTGPLELEVEILSLQNNSRQPLGWEPGIHYSCQVIPPIYFPVSGMVLDSLAGGPVGGATVSIPTTGQVVLSDSDGSFSFAAVAKGVYDVLAIKEGRAGGKLQQVVVDGNQAPLVIIQTEYNLNPVSLTPPTIRLRGLKRGAECSGLVLLKIEVAAGSCPVAATDRHRSIYLKAGTTSLTYHELTSSKDAQLEYLWNASLLPPGEAGLKVVAYDTNNNRSELNFPVLVSAPGGNPPGVAPLEDYYQIIAYTYAESLALARTAGVTARAAENTTIYVEFTVTQYYNGVLIYKAAAAEGEYALLGQSTDLNAGFYKFADYSPELESGMTIFYKLAYFNQYGSGPLTEPVSVRILPQYKLRLVAPANHIILTDTEPTLSWTCEPFLENAQRTDWIIARNVLDASLVAYSFVINQTEITLPPLIYNNHYEWDVRSYYEYINSAGRANVLSRSFPAGRGYSDLSQNGAFYFTIIQQQE